MEARATYVICWHNEALGRGGKKNRPHTQNTKTMSLERHLVLSSGYDD